MLPGVDINRYAYAGNDPVNGSDPNGHVCCAQGVAGDYSNARWTMDDTYQALDMAVDFTPVVGDIKGYYESETWSDYAIATVTLIPGTDALKVVKKVPNPGGKLGDSVTRARTQDVVSDIKARGNTARTEVMIKTPNGYKKVRYADVVEIDPRTGQVIHYHQIGDKTKKGAPVSRERKAKSDIENASGLPVQYHDKRAGPSGGGPSGGGQPKQRTGFGSSFGKWWDSFWK
jgi:hypothetical protein